MDLAARTEVNEVHTVFCILYNKSSVTVMDTERTKGWKGRKKKARQRGKPKSGRSHKKKT